ncbi:TIGR02996 domain-containing protein [Gemmata sp. JC717]|uniref:TIGR02996 domain-containing protein n=1 Tax=Gemmata algarum TaxID=2975278 RepID=UPI0021BA5974|nr:TIGR02996 domain-containing protein [Gemmata algarum]MDY3552787.1 TIGR02996 domain-containing protein [Gemmata algarum]
MNDRDALMAAIAAHPDEDTPRLVFADWLDENADPERAEFIRAQIAQHQNSDGKGDLPPGELARLAARERELLARNRDRWLQPLHDLNARGRVHGDFSRGFVNEVVIDAAVFAERGDELWAVSPVSALHLRHLEPAAERLADCPHLARVRALNLSGAVAPAALRTLLGSPHLAGLRWLSLEPVLFEDDDIEVLADGAALPSLRSFSLSGCPATGTTLPELVGRFPQLESLSLSWMQSFAGRHLAGVLAALNPDRFRTLGADYTLIGTEGMRALAGATRLTGITELWLRGCGFTSESMEVLAGTTHFKQVKKLYLGNDDLGEAGGVAFAGWPGLRTLQVIHFDHGNIGTGGVVAVATSPHLGRPEDLFLRDNGIGDAGAEAIAACDGFSELRELELSRNQITSTGARALATSTRLRHLRQLQLEHNAIGNEGANAIAASPHLRGLRWLTLGDNTIGRAAGRRLVAALPHLTVFSADAGFLTDEHLEAVRAGVQAGGSDADVNAAVGDRLVQAILDHPDDMKTRELYGRFLRDVNSPWWVAIELQNSQSPEKITAGWRALFEDGRDDWLAPLLPWADLFDDRESFDRGFLRKVRFNGPVPDAVADELARFPPLALLPLEVQRGNMTGEGAFQVLARRRHLARMPRLEFVAVAPAELAHVLASPHVAGLEELAFGPCGLDDDTARLLAAAAPEGLTALDFGARRDEPNGRANRIGPEGLSALGASPRLAGLRALGLAGCDTVGDRGLRSMLAAPHLTKLDRLDLRSTGLTADGVRALVAAPVTARLTALRLGGRDRLTDDAVRALARSPNVRNLEELDLEQTGATAPGDEAARELAGSEALAALNALTVRGWRLTDRGSDALRAAFGDRVVCEG